MLTPYNPDPPHNPVPLQDILTTLLTQALWEYLQRPEVYGALYEHKTLVDYGSEAEAMAAAWIHSKGLPAVWNPVPDSGDQQPEPPAPRAVVPQVQRGTQGYEVRTNQPAPALDGHEVRGWAQLTQQERAEIARILAPDEPHHE